MYAELSKCFLLCHDAFAQFSRKRLIAIAFGILSIYLLTPYLLLLGMSLTSVVDCSPPYSPLFYKYGSILNIRLNFTHYARVLSESVFINALCSSLIIAVLSTLICLIIGLPMAYAIYRSNKHMQIWLLMLIFVPFWTSTLLRIYAFMHIVSHFGLSHFVPVTNHLSVMTAASMYNTLMTCTCIAYTYLPFMIFPISSALDKIEYSYIEASYDLGASSPYTLLHVVIPMAKNGIYTGCLMIFIPSIGEYLIPQLLGSSNTLGYIIGREFSCKVSWPSAAALSVLTILFVIIPIIVMQKTFASKKRNNTETEDPHTDEETIGVRPEPLEARSFIYTMPHRTGESI